MFDPVFKDKLQPMEKKKLLRLENECEELWKVASKLDSQRNKLLKKIRPNNQEELQLLKDKRNEEKEIIKNKIHELKEERKAINEKFKEDSRWIREERKKKISEDSELAKNKILKEDAWQNNYKKRNEWNDYYRLLYEKYAKSQNSEVKDEFST